MQWIEEADGVFRGGGVKGIALAGALAGFAKHPTKPVRRWKNVAGASAGAIIACYLACGHDADEMVELLCETPFASFEDPPHGRLGGVLNLAAHHGYAKGDAFERWFDDQLESATFAAVAKDDQADHGRDWRLKLVAVDVTRRGLLVLPHDLADYRSRGGLIDPDTFPISRAARMSMSIPYFFEPVRLEHKDGTDCVIIDGGTLSNFPVWLFDVNPAERLPSRATFGFNLRGGRGFAAHSALLERLTPWPLRFALDIFHTAQDGWDARFSSHSTRVRTLSVDADDVATTDFELTDQKRDLLLANGRSAAAEFLEQFSLDDYINGFGSHLDPAVAGAAAAAAAEGAA